MKKYVLLALGVLFTGLAIAGATQPSGPAGENPGSASVDYATGTFQYTLPLAELKAGDFSLPIRLNYSARGVRPTDFSGAAGYNWGVSAGPVITRAVRGVDDDRQGFIYNFKDGSIPNAAEIDKINENRYDCELDVYQLMMNGQTVPFVLHWGVMSGVEPLVRSDLKIEYRAGRPALSFLVTDGEGREYLFKATDFLGVSQESEISANNYVSSYPNAWYPTEIRVPGQDTIRFSYQNGKSLLNLQVDRFTGFPVADTRVVNYHYGRSITVHPFRFENYEAEYQEYMQKAIETWEAEAYREYLNSMRENQQYVMRHVIYRIGNNEYYEAKWVPDKGYEKRYAFDQQKLAFRKRVMGILGDWKEISVASRELVYALATMINQLGSSAAADYVYRAKECVKRCLRENFTRWENYQYSTNVYYFNPAYLTGVVCGEDSISFGYIRSAGDFPVLQTLKSYHQDKMCGQVNLAFNSSHQLLKSVEVKGNSGLVSEKWRFDYYHENVPWSYQDHWGYFSDQSSIMDMGSGVRPDGIIRNSLARITNSRGGTIDLSYEPNEGPQDVVPGKWGGLRIKGQFTDNGAGSTDSIFYRYPERGKLVFDTVQRDYMVNYRSFSDMITYPRYQFEGNAIIRTGNEGLYYPYVQEVMKGKGMTAYLYSVAPPAAKGRCDSYSWWLTGQLLGTASYDEDNHLVRVTQNRYAATLDYTGDFAGRDFYEPADAGYAFRDSLWQVKSYPYYSNEQYMMEEVLIYDDFAMDSYYITKGGDMIGRGDVPVPAGFRQFYRLYFGGAVLLKKSMEYRCFTPHAGVPGRSDIEHPERIPGCCPVQQVEYHYDNPLHVQPTRVETLQSDGSRRSVLSYTALDIEPGADAMADSMRACHLVAPVLKQQVFTQAPGNPIPVLQEETVAKRHPYPSANGRHWWLPGDLYRWHYRPETVLPALPAFPASSLFSFPASAYRKEQSCDYRLAAGKIAQTAISVTDGTIIEWYDRPGGRILLTATGTGVQQVDAVQGRYLPQQAIDVLYLRYFLEVVIPGISPDDCLPSLQEYLAGASFQKMKSFLTEVYIYFYTGWSTERLWPLRKQLNEEDLFNFRNNFIPWLITHLQFLPVHQRVDDLLLRLWLFSESDFEKYYQGYGDLLFPEFDKSPTASPFYASELHVVQPLESTYRLWMYVKPELGTHEVQVQCQFGNGTSRTLQIPVEAGKYRLFSRDITIPEGSEGVRITLPGTACIGCAALVPATVSFRMSATDAFGREEIHFDESGVGERYVYDGANRVSMVYDTEGNLLQQINYHSVNP